LKEVFAREYITEDAEIEAKTQAINELGPAMPTGMPGTTNMPGPIVPPRPKLTNSNSATDYL